MRPSSSLIEAINVAIAAHVAWKQRFFEHMAGTITLDLLEIEQANVCSFGRWLEGAGKAQLTIAEYAIIYQLHAEFHRIAALIAWQREGGMHEKTLKTLKNGNEFYQASERLIDALEAIKTKQATLLNQSRPVFNKPG
jgi:Chemoreceptor zinc-binding domain